jgi:peptidoglycan-associated lipoprotein
MLKNLFTLSAVFLLISCSGKPEFLKKLLKTDSQPVEQTEILEPAEEILTPYETIDDEAQAIELNAIEEQKIEEVEVQDRIFFGYDSFTLNDEAKNILNTQVAWLKSDINIKVTVEGHADERGTREYNIALGEKRAKSVRDYLVTNGVEAARVKSISYGKERPAFFGATNDVFSKNRRAVTVIN